MRLVIVGIKNETVKKKMGKSVVFVLIKSQFLIELICFITINKILCTVHRIH